MRFFIAAIIFGFIICLWAYFPAFGLLFKTFLDGVVEEGCVLFPFAVATSAHRCVCCAPGHTPDIGPAMSKA